MDTVFIPTVRSDLPTLACRWSTCMFAAINPLLTRLGHRFRCGSGLHRDEARSAVARAPMTNRPPTTTAPGGRVGPQGPVAFAIRAAES
jgi:hypothetical protein